MENISSLSDTIIALPCGCDLEGTHIKTFKFAHYRGFTEEQTLAPSLPNGNIGSGLTVIVGKNNSGKSTIFEAITRINPRRLLINEGTVDNDATFYIENCALETNSNSHKIKAPGIIIGNDYQWDNDIFPKSRQIIYLRSPRNWSASSKFDTSYQGELKEGFSAELYDGNLQMDNPLKAFKAIDESFGFVLRSISFNKDEKDELVRYVKRVIPEFNDYSVNKVKNNFIVNYRVSSKYRHTADYLGAGLHSILKMFSFLVSDRPVILIDEPEYGLHPQAQAEVAKIISEVAAKKQIIIATHSPYFINHINLLNGGTIARVGINNISKMREIYQIKPRGHKYLKSLNFDWHKPEQFDVVAREMFFSDNLVFTEGKEDVALIHNELIRRNMSVNFELFGYGARGAPDIINYLNLAHELGLSAGAIFDNDSTTLPCYETCQNEFGHKFLIHTIPTPDIRDKDRVYGKHGKILHESKEGLFKSTGKLKSEYESSFIDLIDIFIEHFTS